jgi:membrane associated rhomboid family serine protease
MAGYVPAAPRLAPHVSHISGTALDRSREPIFNLPRAMVSIVLVLLVIHIARLILPFGTDLYVVYLFGFVPARYAVPEGLVDEFPGGFGSEVWSFVTYALLHGDWLHLGINVAWMVAFGTPVLRRFGTSRFLLLSIAAAVGGALAHLWTHWGSLTPMIGASAAISGQMGAAVRFAFQPGGPLGALGRGEEWRWRIPAVSLPAAFRNIRVVAFVAVWFLVNLAFGTTSTVPGEAPSIAWQAHIGGFLVGLLLFRLFDPWRHMPPPPPAERPDWPDYEAEPDNGEGPRQLH